jgi:hypothetical protein
LILAAHGKLMSGALWPEQQNQCGFVGGVIMQDAEIMLCINTYTTVCILQVLFF